MEFIFLILQSLIGTQAIADELCNRSREAIALKFSLPENRIAFQNNDGLINGGVCWWHSRLQRSSIHLVKFSPEKPRPTQWESKKIIEQLIEGRNVVTIPGYSNFFEFTKDYEPLIQRELNQWQVRDGFIYQQWVRGAYGHYRLPADQLKHRMNLVFKKFKASKPGMFLMAQMQGITSHAILLTEMFATETGYHLKVVDSNYPSITREVNYENGDQSLLLGSFEFVPYVGFEAEQAKLDRTVQRHCQP